MSTLSVAERKRYREKQKKKQGIPLESSSSPVVVPTPSSGQGSPIAKSPVKTQQALPSSENVVATHDASGSRPPPSSEIPAAKRQRTGAAIELGLPQRGEGAIDVAWKDVLKCRKRADGPADAPIRSAFDSRYPLNNVLNAAAGAGDVEKVAALGIRQTLVAVKTYGHYASVLAHLAEDAFNKTAADHGRLEEAWKKSKEELEACKVEKARLEQELGKWDMEKRRLEEKVFDLTAAKRKLEESLERANQELEAAQAEAASSNGVLKGIWELFPNLPVGGDLVAAIDGVKASVAENFDNGFDRALEQLKVIYPEVDIGRFDPDKVVVNGELVDEEAVEGGCVATADDAATVALNLDKVDEFLSDTEVGRVLADGEGGVPLS